MGQTARTPCEMLDRLEPRVLLYGAPPYPFVGAGLSFDPASGEPSGMFWAQGTVLADDSFVGSYERFDASTRSGPQTLPWSAFTRPNNDQIRLMAGTDPAYASQQANQFIAQQGFPAGPFVGRDASDAALDMGEFVEPYNVAPFGLGVYLQQDYFIASMLVMTPERPPQVVTLVAIPHSFKSPDYTFKYVFPEGTIQFDDVHVVSETPTLTEFDNGVRVYSTYRGSTNFFVVDPDNSDGIVGFGTATARWALAPDRTTPSDITGVYRGQVMVSGPESAAFFGVSGAPTTFNGAGVADVVVRFDSSGDFSVYRAEDYDLGVRQPLNTGTWVYEANPRLESLDLGRIRVTDAAGRNAIFRATRFHAGMLQPLAVYGAGQSTAPSAVPGESVWGMVTFGTYTPITDGLDLQEAVFSVDEAGHVIAYQHATSSDATKVGWYATDLLDSFGGQAVVGPLYAWHDLDFTRVDVVGRAVGGDLILWERVDDQWSVTDLTASIDGALPLGGDLVGANFGGDFFRHPSAAIVATDQNGQFIAYIQHAAGAWEFVPVEAGGLLGAGVHPNFVTPLAGFGTAWNGYNFAGLDDQGQIWVLWHSPALGAKWSTDNLSAIAGGTPAITSHLTAITTPWDAFQVTGLDSRGHIIVTWWAREVGWRYDGLTDLVGGPSFVGVEVASNYNLALNVINIVGLDADGDAVVYWWSPKLGWHVGYPATGLSASTRPTGPMLFDGFRVPYTNIPGLIDSFQSITWQAASGHTMRLSWHVSGPDLWALDDLTEIAKPL